ncbi:hypothetical protein MAR_034452 [Mya arenaria]|uniref:Uncharacterized protein n=1 Tax=Mya arenaria TaxID=6604 RepID=A0ABY7GBX5_MYAAR|nr:hypothetical protein MAR_034452 [Mya arenaria]
MFGSRSHHAQMQAWKTMPVLFEIPPDIVTWKSEMLMIVPGRTYIRTVNTGAGKMVTSHI